MLRNDMKFIRVSNLTVEFRKLSRDKKNIHQKSELKVIISLYKFTKLYIKIIFESFPRTHEFQFYI